MNCTVVSHKDYFDSEENPLYFHSESKKKNKLIRGGLYRLRQKITIDSSIFSVKEKTFRLFGIIHKIKDVPFEGVVMKQLSGDPVEMSFTLSKQQCQILHIKYQYGLQIFPMSIKFDRIVERFNDMENEFDKNDLSTYEHSPIDGTIRDILIKLDDFEYCSNNKKKIKNKKTGKIYNLIDTTEDFYPVDYIIYKIAGVDIKSKVFLKTTDLKSSNVFKQKVFCKPYDIVDYYLTKSSKNNDVLIEIPLTSEVIGGFTEDGDIGIDKEFFKNKKLEDIFLITDSKE